MRKSKRCLFRKLLSILIGKSKICLFRIELITILFSKLVVKDTYGKYGKYRIQDKFIFVYEESMDRVG